MSNSTNSNKNLDLRGVSGIDEAREWLRVKKN